MKPYWNSTLTYQEAQNLSKDGVAILGNPVMKDVIWPKESKYPFIWCKTSYKPLEPKLFENRIGWVPAEPVTDDTFG